MKKALLDMLGSKKFLAMIAAVLVATAGKFGLDLSTESVLLIIGPIMVYIGGQGLADFGKEKKPLLFEALDSDSPPE